MNITTHVLLLARRNPGHEPPMKNVPRDSRYIWKNVSHEGHRLYDHGPASHYSRGHEETVALRNSGFIFTLYSVKKLRNRISQDQPKELVTNLKLRLLPNDSSFLQTVLKIESLFLSDLIGNRTNRDLDIITIAERVH
jgi:hypothetical protein